MCLNSGQPSPLSIRFTEYLLELPVFHRHLTRPHLFLPELCWTYEPKGNSQVDQLNHDAVEGWKRRMLAVLCDVGLDNLKYIAKEGQPTAENCASAKPG
jgi:hypothetical protein